MSSCIIGAGALVAAVCALSTLSTMAEAQRGVDATSQSFQVAVPDSFPAPGARALVVRFASGRDLILLNRNHATSEALGAAVALLKQLRRNTERVANTQVVTVQGFTALRSRRERLNRGFQAALDALNRQPVARIGNLGRGRWIEIGAAGTGA